MATTESARLKDDLKTFAVHFNGPNNLTSLPASCRSVLKAFVDDCVGRISQDEVCRCNDEARKFWLEYVQGKQEKRGVFIGILKELRPVICVDVGHAKSWYEDVVRPVLIRKHYSKEAVEDAQEIIIEWMAHDHDEDDEAANDWQMHSAHCIREMLSKYLFDSTRLADGEVHIVADVMQVVQQIEHCLIQAGRKRPKRLFWVLCTCFTKPKDRVHCLSLLNNLLRHESPHLYTVADTYIVDVLLKCLMNDTDTTVLSVALTSLIMLLPHIPGSLTHHMPRMFLVYSRLLCWERFSALATVATRNLVTDERYPQDEDHGDVGIDPNWQKARPKEGVVEAATPELLTYFTYLYGLFPLNFMEYVRKPRRYLKFLKFPHADDFDLDRMVIRERTEQFRQVHRLHPNFYQITIEEERDNPKWPNMDPADVVAECLGLYINSNPTMPSAGPPPTSPLPPLPRMPVNPNGSLSPSLSHHSLHSAAGSMSETMGDPESPTLGPPQHKQRMRSRSRGDQQDKFLSELDIDPTMFPLPGPSMPGAADEASDQQSSNTAYLYQQLELERNRVYFVTAQKNQYAQHISQLMRKNVKDATTDAEMRNVINANRTLKLQLEQVRLARETTMRDAMLIRKQAASLEEYSTERMQKMKEEREVWMADAEELRRHRAEIGHHRGLLSASEARELNLTHKLTILEREMKLLEGVNAELSDAKQRIKDLEWQITDAAHKSPGGGSYHDLAKEKLVADTQAKLAALRSQHDILLAQNTDLRLELSIREGPGSTIRSNSIGMNSDLMSGALPGRPGIVPSISDVDSSHASMPAVGASSSTYRPSTTRSGSSTTSHRYGRSIGYNTTEPLRPDERSLASDSDSPAKEVIKYHGRGGNQATRVKKPSSGDVPKKQGLLGKAAGKIGFAAT